MKLLVACERFGLVRDSFRAAGHDAWSCDIMPNPSTYHIQGDVLSHLTDGWDMMIAHPPCTYLCVTGNKWFKPEYHARFPDRQQRRNEAIEFFMALASAPIARICIENPVGVMSTLYRRPDQIIQPYMFGHPEPKKTCLWLKGLPLLTPTCNCRARVHGVKVRKATGTLVLSAEPITRTTGAAGAHIPGHRRCDGGAMGVCKHTRNLTSNKSRGRLQPTLRKETQ